MSDRSPRLSDEHGNDWAEPAQRPEHDWDGPELAENQALYGQPDLAGGPGARSPRERTIDGVINLDPEEEHLPPDWVQQMEAEAAEHAIPTSTARITDDMALFGPSPIRSEHDSRDVWVNLGQPISFDAALPPHVQASFDQLGEALESALDAITPHGFQISRRREPLLWGLINAINHQAKAEEKHVTRLSQEVMDLRRTESQRIREQGRDPASLELEEKTHELQSAAAIQEVFEHFRDYAADFYFHENNKVWEPRGKATQTSQSENVATQIAGRDFLRAREKHLPVPDLPEKGTLIAVAGTKVGPSHDTIIKALDAELQETPDMILAHGGARGVQTIASSWAKTNNVPEIVFLPEFDKFPKNAILRRDDQMLLAGPERVISFTAEGQRLPRLHTGALERGIDVRPVSDRNFAQTANRDAARAAPGLDEHQPAYNASPQRSADPSPHQGFIEEQKQELRSDRYAASFLDPDAAADAAHRAQHTEHARPPTPTEQAIADTFLETSAAAAALDHPNQAPLASPAEQAAADTFLELDRARTSQPEPAPDLTVTQAFDTLIDKALPRDDELSEESVRHGHDDRHPLRTRLMASVINAIHSVTAGPGGASDRLSDRAHEAKQLQREDTQSEIDINRQADNHENIRYARDSLGSIEQARAQLATHFHEETGRYWTPPASEEISAARNLTSASVEALTTVERLEQRRHEARLPDGVPIVVTALQQGVDRDTVFAQLDRVHAKKPDMYIAHGNAPGVLQDVSDWAVSRKVEQVHFNLDYSVPAQMRIIKRDEAILDINPVGVVEFRNGDKTTHLADAARRHKIPVLPVRSPTAQDASRNQDQAHGRAATDPQQQQHAASQAAGMSW